MLARAAKVFPQIAGDPIYRNAKQQFISLSIDGSDTYPDISLRKISDNQQGHDSDRYFSGLSDTFPNWTHFRSESSTYLWYPWTMAAALMIQKDSSSSDDERRKAGRLVESLSKRSTEVVEFASGDSAIYPVAELGTVYGLYLDSLK